VSGLAGKWVAANVPGLGEVKRGAPASRRIRARSRVLASRGTVKLRDPGMLARATGSSLRPPF